MRLWHKAAHPRRGSVSIEAAFFMIVSAIILFGIVNVITEMRDYYRLNTLTDHVGQAVARSDSLSAATIQAILSAASADTMVSHLKGLCVTVANQEKTLLSVPGSTCTCSSQAASSSSVMSALTGATSNMSAVVVVGCSDKLQSSSVFITTAEISD